VAAGWASRCFFSVCQNRSILPWVVGLKGLPFFWVMPRAASSVSKPLPAPVALRQPPVMELVHEGLRDPVAGRDLPVGQALEDDGFDQDLVLGHPFTMS
jgi:hypothetical protein